MKNPIFGVLGVALIATVLIIIANFIITKLYIEIWSQKWTMSVFFIMALSIAGLLLIYQASDKDKNLMSLIGFGYSILSIIIYGYFGYTQSINYHGFWSFIGFTIFFSTITGIVFWLLSEDIVSYGYLMASLSFTIWLVYKYVFSDPHFYFWVLMGEILIVIGGVAVFFIMYNIEDIKKQ